MAEAPAGAVLEAGCCHGGAPLDRAADQMESTARYLTSGRRFASLETEEIKKRWTQAARTFLISYDGINPREMDDLGSELGLRKGGIAL
jgi:hypothetical protein